MTPVTISSLMPSTSILYESPGPPGDGGGVCSYVVLPLFFGRSAKETDLGVLKDAVDDRGREVETGDGEFEE